MDPDSSVTKLKGVGEKTARLFAGLGIYTIRDLIEYYPRDYIRMPEEKEIDEAICEGRCALLIRVSRSPEVNTRSRLKTAVLDVRTKGDMLRFLWFRRPYIRSIVRPGNTYIFYGNIVRREDIYLMEQPDIYAPADYEVLKASLLPVYPLTKGITNNLIKKSIRTALETCECGADYLCDAQREQLSLISRGEALRAIHFPQDEEECQKAAQRLIFDEFLFFILSMHLAGGDKARPKTRFLLDAGDTKRWEKALPYELTGAQKRALLDIEEDMRSGYAMQRLLQGDVGSGKTAVAFFAMALCADAGYQAAIMAPTEVLAIQHFKKLKEFCRLCGLNIPVLCLIGSMSAKEKRKIYEQIECEKPLLIAGTHALFQEKARFGNLALAVTDEQHRFGVSQRAYFAKKGINPHILLMSATPIPRTLAIILYGNMDITVIDEMPQDRLPVKNCAVGTSFRNSAYKFIYNEVKKGHQAYVICPLVEDSDLSVGENVLDYSEKLKGIFPEDIRIETLHGRMKPDEKNRVMADFAEGRTDILVSTTVVEVGVDAPNATVMLIENADRFGLSQLHQLRGRVGRGKDQSYCIFMNSSDSKNERLEIVSRSDDGFYISSQDLKMRGPGDFFGIRQSGDFSFKIADVYRDHDLLALASKKAGEIIKEDPGLDLKEHSRLREMLRDENKGGQEGFTL